MITLWRKTNLFLAIWGAVAVLILSGCGGGEFKYAKYINRSPEIGISVDYLDGWKSSEYKEANKKYPTVSFLPLKEKGPLYILVDIMKTENLGISPVTLDAVAKDTIAKRSKFPEAKLLSKEKIRLLGTEGKDIQMSFEMTENLHTLNSKSIATKARMIVLRKNDAFYVLKLIARQEDFEKYNRAFNHIIRTFRIIK